MSLRSGKLALAAGVAAALAITGPALAFDGSDGDRVYADSFGNLVIESAAGYKRILVGEGHEAERMAQFLRAGQPKVVYGIEKEDGGVLEPGCYRPPWLLKGRGYMYGFDQGEIPFQGGPCS